MFSELITNPWFNQFSVGACLGLALYPLLVWRRGYRQTAAYFLSPADFSGPAECYGSLNMERESPQSAALCLFGHLIGLIQISFFGAFVFGLFLFWPLFSIFGKAG